MGFWREFGVYLKSLVALDWTQTGLFCFSVASLVLGTLLLHSWGIVIFLVILMFSSFRLWRDERLIAAHEGEQLTEIARRMRDEIERLDGSPHRMFSYAPDPRDRSHHERMFQKHLPNIAVVAERWLENPDLRDNARIQILANVQQQIPEGIPPAMGSSIANAICSYVEESLYYSEPPPGRFDAELMEFKGQDPAKVLRFQDRPGQYAIFNAGLDPSNVDEIALDLNQLSQAAWRSSEAEVWRELTRTNWRDREQLSDYLTDVINGRRLTRKHCDRACFELSSGD